MRNNVSYADIVAAAEEVVDGEVWAAYEAAGGKEGGITGAPPAARTAASSPPPRSLTSIPVHQLLCAW